MGLQPTSLVQAGVAPERSRLPYTAPSNQKDDYAQMMKNAKQQLSYEYEHLQNTSTKSEAHLTYDYPPTHRETIERYIAVPINSTDHLLLSSTGIQPLYFLRTV